MALTLGSVSVSAAGVVTKSGECGTLFDLLEADAQTAIAAFPGASLPTGPDAVPRLRAQARQATTIATYIYGLLTARATVRISTSTGALQQAGGVDTTAPTANRFLPIV